MKAGVGFRRQYAELGEKKKKSPVVCTLGFIGLLHRRHSRRQGIRGGAGGWGGSKIQLSVGDPEEMKVTFYFSNYGTFNNRLMFSVIFFKSTIIAVK